jgi:hypothetical protein
VGVTYTHYLIPEDNTYKPRPEELSRLVSALLDGGYVIDPGSQKFREMTFGTYTYYDHARQTGCLIHDGPDRFAPFPCPCSARDVAALGDRDYRLVWPVEDLEASGLEYPLVEIPFDGNEVYYDLELHVAKDFVYRTSEIIEPFGDPREGVTCRCGTPLEYFDREDDDHSLSFEVYTFHIHRYCPSCGAPFRPQEHAARIRSARTGEEVGPRMGGATSLFAIVVDCGKCHDWEEWPTRASDAFLRTCCDALGITFNQIGDGTF